LLNLLALPTTPSILRLIVRMSALFRPEWCTQGLVRNPPLHEPHRIRIYDASVETHSRDGEFVKRPPITHASTLVTKIEGDLCVTPDVLARCRAVLDVDLDFGWFVVSPSCGIATADGALAFVDKVWPSRDGDRDCATVACPFDWGVG